MPSYQQVLVIGHLGQNPEVKYMPSGKAVCNISVATSEKWKDKQTNQDHEETEWHRITCYGRLAEIVGEYLKKGSAAMFEGKLKTRKWQDNNGVDRYTTEIIARNMQMLGSKGAGVSPLPKPENENSMKNDFEDDIPF